MSIFDDSSGMNPLPYLQEKTLAALREAVRLVDLANEPDTTRWYRRELQGRAASQIGRLLPVVSLLFGLPQEAVVTSYTETMSRSGSLALASWCKEWQVTDPQEVAFASVLPVREDEETQEKAEENPARNVGESELFQTARKLQVYGSMVGRLLYLELPDEAKRLLLWLLRDLWLTSAADVVTVSRRFLPSDIDSTPEATLGNRKFKLRVLSKGGSSGSWRGVSRSGNGGSEGVGREEDAGETRLGVADRVSPIA